MLICITLTVGYALYLCSDAVDTRVWKWVNHHSNLYEDTRIDILRGHKRSMQSAMLNATLQINEVISRDQPLTILLNGEWLASTHFLTAMQADMHSNHTLHHTLNHTVNHTLTGKPCLRLVLTMQSMDQLAAAVAHNPQPPLSKEFLFALPTGLPVSISLQKISEHFGTLPDFPQSFVVLATLRSTVGLCEGPTTPAVFHAYQHELSSTLDEALFYFLNVDLDAVKEVQQVQAVHPPPETKSPVDAKPSPPQQQPELSQPAQQEPQTSLDNTAESAAVAMNTAPFPALEGISSSSAGPQIQRVSLLSIRYADPTNTNKTVFMSTAANLQVAMLAHPALPLLMRTCSLKVELFYLRAMDISTEVTNSLRGLALGEDIVTPIQQRLGLADSSDMSHPGWDVLLQLLPVQQTPALLLSLQMSNLSLGSHPVRLRAWLHGQESTKTLLIADESIRYTRVA